MPDHTPYQQKIIRRYYQNFDDIQRQRFSELMTDLYLAEGKSRDRLWKRVGEILEKLGFPPQRTAYLLARRDPALLPGVLRELESGQFSGDRARPRDSQDS